MLGCLNRMSWAVIWPYQTVCSRLIDRFWKLQNIDHFDQIWMTHPNGYWTAIEIYLEWSWQVSLICQAWLAKLRFLFDYWSKQGVIEDMIILDQEILKPLSKPFWIFIIVKNLYILSSAHLAKTTCFSPPLQWLPGLFLDAQVGSLVTSWTFSSMIRSDRAKLHFLGVTIAITGAIMIALPFTSSFAFLVTGRLLQVHSFTCISRNLLYTSLWPFLRHLK